jgi:hypothetical protein
MVSRDVVVEQLACLRSTGCAAMAVGIGVPQGSEEVAKVVVVAKQSGTLEHVEEGLLHEILGVVPRPAQCPRRPIQPVDVIPETVQLE